MMRATPRVGPDLRAGRGTFTTSTRSIDPLPHPPPLPHFGVQRSAFDVQRFRSQRASFWLALLLASLLLPSAPTSASTLPPLSGNLSGEFKLFDGHLTIPWKATVEPDASGSTRFAFTAELPQGAIRARLALDAMAEQGAWQIDEARVDVQNLVRTLAPVLPADLPQFSVTGALEVTGTGDWRDGEPVGPLAVTWYAPTVTGTDPELSIEDLSLAFTVSSGWANGSVQGDGTLRAARATVAGVVLERIESAYSVRNDGSVRVTKLNADAFGGTIDFAPFSWSASMPELVVGLEFDGVDLDLLAAAMPDLIGDARGEVRGRARFRWREDIGLEPLGGELSEIKAGDVQVTLAPTPGFLTSNLPRRIQILPDWLGRLSKQWFAPENPAYATLEKIEMGREPLVVDDFVLEFFPPDDPLSRTVTIRIEGRPREDPLLEKVVLTINLSGPLTELLRLSSEHNVEFGLGK